jgi:hypothetical protein
MSTLGDVVHLVSCVKEKRDRPCPATDLYISDWFLKARHYVEAQGGPWFILSAEYGLLPPERIVAPYERTLNKMSKRERDAWAQRVLLQIEEIPNLRRVVFLAGARYRESLASSLKGRGIESSVPMEGLSIGRQLRWLKQHVP